jgi:acyl-CoA synthetase (AMP-forming)/AMP-acid ligase II
MIDDQAPDVPAYDWREIEASVRPENIGQLLRESAERNGDRVLFNFFETGRTLTYRELDEAADKVATALRGLGVGPGEHVAVMLHNDPEFPIVFAALARLGAVMVSVNTRSTAGELDHVLADADVSAMIIDASLIASLQQSTFADRFDGKLVMTNQDVLPHVENEGVPWDDLLAHDDPWEPVAVRSTDPVTILYTSGSTGLPKGCVHSHLYWLVLAQSSAAANRKDGFRNLNDSPFFYMTGPSSTINALWHDGDVYMPRRTSLKRFMDWVREFDITSTWVTVLQFADAPRPDDRSHRLRIALSDDIPGDRITEFEERFGIKARNLYAMTEIGLGTVVPDDADEMAIAGSIGIPAPFRECMIINEDFEPITSAGATGEMCVRGIGMFDGYYNKPDANAESFLPGGWFRTGDIVTRDDRGWYYFNGRAKDIVRRAGENISAVEVESALEAVAGVAKAVVVPVPDEKRGEEVKAYLLLEAGVDQSDVSPEKLVEQLEGSIAEYKIPRYFEYRQSFPTTASDKISKVALRAEREDLRTHSYDRRDRVWR